MTVPAEHIHVDAVTGVPASVPALDVEGVTKQFGAFRALDAVDLQLASGEIHALLGENGAGKTTLMNVVTGILTPDDGAMRLFGEPFAPASPRAAIERGVGCVYQQFRLVANLTVAQNLHLGWEQTPQLLSARVLEQRTAELAASFGIETRPDAKVWQLAVGEKQRVAILRALVRGARILILDEPTAVLTPPETRGLFVNLKEVAESGRTVVFISHKLNEVTQIADNVTVLRGGRRIATVDRANATATSLARRMVGRDVSGADPRVGSRVPGPRMLEARGLQAHDDWGMQVLHDVELDVHAGQIVGIAGVSGNGQRELAEVLTGLRPSSAGTVAVCGAGLPSGVPSAATRAGVGFVPEDVKSGLALDAPIEVNAALREINSPRARRGPFVKPAAIRAAAREILSLARLDAIPSGRAAGTLSGGQAQRLAVYREIQVAERVLVAAYPARGLDVAATIELHDALVRLRDAGRGIVLISEDLDEILKLSDVVVVMYEGRVAGRRDRATLDRAEIGLLMAGQTGGEPR